MAGFIYDGGRVSLSDSSGTARLTFHLHLVADRRFKDGEGFFLTIAGSDDGKILRDSFWFHPSVPIRFFYDDAEPVDLDRTYLEELVEESRGPLGIHVGNTDLFVVDLPDDEAAQSDTPPESTDKVG